MNQEAASVMPAMAARCAETLDGLIGVRVEERGLAWMTEADGAMWRAALLLRRLLAERVLLTTPETTNEPA